MNKKAGIIISLVGAGLFFVSFLMSENYHPSLDLLSNIYRMEIVFKEGYFQEARKEMQYGVYTTVEPSYYEGRISVPLKYALSLSIMLFLVGLSGVFLGKNTEKEEELKDEEA